MTWKVYNTSRLRVVLTPYAAQDQNGQRAQFEVARESVCDYFGWIGAEGTRNGLGTSITQLHVWLKHNKT